MKQEDYKQEKLLKELQKNTGIEFAIIGDSSEDNDETLSKLERLVKSYKASDRREYFLERLLRGEVSSSQLLAGAKKFHIDRNTEFAVYYIEVSGNNDVDVQELLETLLISQTSFLVVPIDGEDFVVLKSVRKNERQEASYETAEMILDMLNTEAMLDAKIALGNTKGKLECLTEGYKEARLAMKVGKIFYPQEYIFNYSNLGIGRLIYELPLEACKAYVKEVFGDTKPAYVDEEMITTIKAFFDNGLNISETARQLYVHRNTLIYRLEKIEKVIGLDIRNFENAMTYKIVAMVMENIEYQEGKNNER